MKNIAVFDSFSPEISNFFENLTHNNNKLWFDENRKFYEKEIKDKSKLFVELMAKHFFDNNLPFISDSKLSLFRINRDIRFSANKDPYKTNLGVFFPYSENPSLVSKEFSLGLYIHFEKGKSFIASGLHSPDTQTLKSLRNQIADNYEEFLIIVNDKSFRKNFPDTFSSQKPLTRFSGFPKDHPAAEYLKQKDFSFGLKISDDVFFNNKLGSFIIEKAKSSKNYLQFLYNAIYKQ